MSNISEIRAYLNPDAQREKSALITPRVQGDSSTQINKKIYDRYSINDPQALYAKLCIGSMMRVSWSLLKTSSQIAQERLLNELEKTKETKFVMENGCPLTNKHMNEISKVLFGKTNIVLDTDVLRLGEIEAEQKLKSRILEQIEDPNCKFADLLSSLLSYSKFFKFFPDEFLISAAKAGHIFLVDLFTFQNLNKNARDQHGKTPLFWACENGHEEVILLLKKAGANVTLKDDQGRMASWAYENGFSLRWTAYGSEMISKSQSWFSSLKPFV